jgi:two-component system OmpR family response regulator
MRVLIAEDDAAIAAGVAAALRHGGHAVDVVEDGARADSALHDIPYDLLVLDLGLPKLDGSEVLERLRRRGGEIPVLVITAREGLRERVRVLDLGADDYLVKPFALDEFKARVRALLRRVASKGTPELKLGRLRVDLPGRRAWIDEAPLELTAREFGVLAALAARVGRLTSRAQLVESLCSWDQELTDNGLDIAVHRLRRKLRGCGTGVRTIRGLGYMLEEESSGG